MVLQGSGRGALRGGELRVLLLSHPLEVPMRSRLPLLLLAALATAACASTTGSCPRLPPPETVQGFMPCGAPPPACVTPPPDHFPFQNLVLQGGGVKGVAYIRACQQLQALGALHRIQRVAAAS